MSKVFTVFGATGNQGGSVIRAVLADPVLSKEYKLRGVTRDVSKPAAQALIAQGVEVVKAAAPAVKGAHSVFLVTNFWESMSDKTEMAQGKAVTDACKAAGVEHLIFSSLIDVSHASGGRLSHVTHFDGKARIEQYIRGSGIRCTFVQPGLFMSGFLGFIRKQDDGSLAWAMPEGVKPDQAQLPLFDAAADTGIFVKAALRSTSDGKVIRAATDYYTPARIVAEFEQAAGKEVAYREVPHEAFKSSLPPAAAQELLENMLLFQDPGYYAGAGLEDSLALLGHDKPTTWKAYVEENKAKWD
ncbi:NmrA family transcriptional regulator [Metarhizium album ARSEF 1941]|uniref:NmrA family transcriptional regulator n=1 Tax=Metarhizium album (strain ARSEF 1941) TaxID=1081103 RepID=A0A0B2WNE8_METAS|nr:NmrA family transcriptional regulator [Metarhizium album ARSEF 1941]KHN95483.1 NmrA family transcriptional regulator [Metarhizium album ARSEF 1941]